MENGQSLINRVTSVGVSLPPPIAKEKPPINVVGDVSGRIAIMVDDMIDDVQSFVDAAAVLKERGAYKIYVMATHGILSKEAPRLIEDSAIDEVRYILNLNIHWSESFKLGWFTQELITVPNRFEFCCFELF